MSLYLSENKILRLTTLCALYVAQGIPWGFVTVTFAAWLADPKQGMSAAQIGPILAVATLPWSFKFVWGPLMDRFTLPAMGRRRPWIIFAQMMATLMLGSLLFVNDPAGLVWSAGADSSSVERFLLSLVPGPLAGLILLANIFVSMQDVAVDALAVDLLHEDERATANGMMYGSSYVGTAIGGVGLGKVVALYGIQAGLLGQAGLLVLISLLPIFLRERRSEAVADTTVAVGQESAIASTPQLDGVNITSQASVFKDLFRAFSLRSTAVALIVALMCRISVGILTTAFVSHLLSDAGWTQEEYTSIVGGWALALGLMGCVVGGLLADRFGALAMVAMTSILLGLLWSAFGLSPEVLQSRTLVQTMLLTQESLLSVMSVSLFSLFMGLSWPRVAATQFTTYMAILNLSTTIGSYAAGSLSQRLNIQQTLIVAAVLQVTLLLPLALIDPGQTRRELGTA